MTELERTKTNENIYNILKKLTEKYEKGELDINYIHYAYISFLKQYIKLHNDSPSIAEKSSIYDECNHYPYALGLVMSRTVDLMYRELSGHSFVFDSGFLTNSPSSDDPARTILNLYRGFDVLGIEAFDTKEDNDNSHGGDKIAIYLPEEHTLGEEFYLMRQNIEGIWSIKPGYDRTIQRFEKLPEEYNNSYRLSRVLEIVKPGRRG